MTEASLAATAGTSANTPLDNNTAGAMHKHCTAKTQYERAVLHFDVLSFGVAKSTHESS